MRKLLTLLLSLSISCATALAQQIVEPKNAPSEWAKPYPPFRIAGNLYYVGTYDLACYLVTTSQGNILINTGLAASGPLIKENIEALGFKFSDLKLLLTTQAHYDHVGAMAQVKKLTGAQLIVNEKEAPVLEDGGQSDYALGGLNPTFKSLRADRLLQDRDSIQLGDTRMTMLHHPGHTKGSCSFLFQVKDQQRSYRILIANMPTIVTEKAFSDIFEYPRIEKDYAYTLNAMKDLSFDIWLASHASQFGLHSKHKPGQSYNPSAFVDRKGYDTAITALQKEFLTKVKN